MAEYLDLAEYLLIAEAVLGVAAEEIACWPGIGLAESALHAPAAGFAEVELYPDLLDEAAVLCVRLARNHPLPDGNKRVAYLAIVEFLARNDIEWIPPSVDETVTTIERVAAGRSPSKNSPTGSAPTYREDDEFSRGLGATLIVGTSSNVGRAAARVALRAKP